MRTMLVNTVQPLPGDAKILAALNIEPPDNRRGGISYQMGIRNAEGVVYRLVEGQSVGETYRLVSLLQTMGFVEERHREPTAGIRSTFTRYAELAPRPSRFLHRDRSANERGMHLR